MMGYWPAWAGGIGLGAITVGYYVAQGRTVGVSGAWDRVLHWREEREAELDDDGFDEAAFAAALEAATREQFGEDSASVATLVRDDRDRDGDTGDAAAVEAEDWSGVSVAPQRPVPLVSQAAFLLSIFFGGLLAAVLSGRFELRADMGPDFARIVTDGWLMWPILFVGGVLVGFGTRLAGGCSSGHGLSGCGRLQPASIVATATFFGTAVAVSFLLWKVI